MTLGKLGEIVTYHVDKHKTANYKEFAAKIKATGAPVTPLAAPKLADVFRRACEKAHHKDEDPYDAYGTYEYKMVDRGYQKRYVRRQIVCTMHFDKEVKVVNLATAEFDKDTSEWRWKDRQYSPAEEEMILQVRQFMEEHGENLYAQPIRESLRGAIDKEMFGIPLLGRGLFFVPWTQSSELCKLKKMFEGNVWASVETYPVYKVSLPEIQSHFSTHFMGMVQEFYDTLTDMQSRVDQGESVLVKEIIALQAMLDRCIKLRREYEKALGLEAMDFKADQIMVDKLSEDNDV